MVDKSHGILNTTLEPSLKEVQAAHFQREELWGMIRRAEVLSCNVPNPRWKHAYSDVAQALSTLDAFIARATIEGHPGP